MESVYPYRREKKYEKSEEKDNYGKRKGFFTSRYSRISFIFIDKIDFVSLAVSMAGFFLGRAVLFGELHPLGIAFVAGVYWSLKPRGFFALIGVMGGLFCVISGNVLLAEVLCIILVGLVVNFISIDIKRPWLVIPGLVFTILLVIRSSFLAFTDAIPYNYISVLFEAIFAAIFTLLIMNAIPALFISDSPDLLKGEELFYIMVLVAGVIAGTADISWGLFTLKYLLSYFIILIAALVGGMGLGAATGAALGIMPGLAYTTSPAIIGTLAFSGLLAGLFRSFGKTGVVIGFLLGNVILSIYMSSYNELTATVAQVAVVSMLFLCIPVKWLQQLKVSLAPVMSIVDVKDNNDEVRLKELLTEKMGRWSGIFKEIAHSFEQTAPTSINSADKHNLQSLFNDVGTKVCKGCSHYITCWDREFYKTYQTLLSLFALVDTYGRVTVDDLDEDTRSKCARARELAIAITCLYEMFKINSFWSKRLDDSKNLAVDQLKGISEVIDNLSFELKTSEEFYRKESKIVKQKLKKLGINVSTVEVYGTARKKPEVFIVMPSCAGRMICRYEVGPFISKELKCNMSIATTCCFHNNDSDFCSYRLYPEPQYQFSIGVAGLARGDNSISGDSYLFQSLSDGKFALMLSDGMGHGDSAATQSRATLRLIARLMDSGFSRDVVIKTVNSILLLRSPQECFATVDITIFDIYTGEVDFVKIGAVPGFVVRGHRVGIIRADTLPVGIVNDIEILTFSKQLNYEDMVIMVTDGVIDAQDEKENWLLEVLQDVSGLKPQEVADLIVNLARSASDRDDMTALVVRMEKVVQ